ncbi:aminoacyl-tRNA hydrolase [Blochmannia endosymbiont of Camponotus (Colobopsis) obliquus]|uniref:aminoacyl-tRNA hydrolase n=1 Tax=Blochmannia endosymbiont of Camponotus (Colobopsis) obliquus TaxID=1505597 RepID=UPI00061A775C|nr:aminoacyl-tRNA hydrolase [Blochmannia endosymbiont of Camponotus (Colobopsis) obliquus]AKC60508.1 peptidyl-tRNA hydrolase [Blochmannia endosymbiont of Camponotus (Colobopsis) obliquus]
MSIKLIVGLGNYELKYKNTRHNIGIWYINLLTIHHNVTLKKEKNLHGFIGQLKIGNNIVHLLIPNTYMNFSGNSVVAVSNFYKLAPEEILIVHDELDLLPGSTRIKFGGGHAGHNGIKNIIHKLNDNLFYRLRIGIGRPKYKREIINFVLNSPSYHERTTINNTLNKAVLCIKDIVEKKFVEAINYLRS